MIKTKYIIEYFPGCKGDLLKTILDNKEDLEFDEFKRILNNDNKMFLKDMSSQERYAQTIAADEFKNQLLEFAEPINNSHGLFFLQKEEYRQILNQLNIKVKKIIFDQKYYNTIKIESMFKNLKCFNNQLESKINFQRKEDSYRLDYYLLEKNIPINNTNRAELLNVVLKEDNHFRFERLFNSSKHCKHRELLNYQDLYIDFNLTDELLKNLDFEKYKISIEHSWLPEEIEVFDHIWKPIEYGYRCF